MTSSELQDVASFFDDLYCSQPRYWWKKGPRYAADADTYPFSLITQLTLRALAGRPAGRALDLGAGEGADAIRLAMLGYRVTAVEISRVAAGKIGEFAAEAGVPVEVELADISSYEPRGEFDVVICNGALHYVEDKRSVVARMQRATKPGGLNVLSLWSTYSPVPDCHAQVPVFCDDEEGAVKGMYEIWPKELLYFERNKPEMSHEGMEPHSHSHIKLIARKP